MLEHWYFCASLGLLPQTAATHMDIITALAEPASSERSEEVVSSAIECLVRAETARALHALPYVLAAQRRFTGVTEVNAQASALYRIVASVAPEQLRSHVGAALRAAGAGETAKAVSALGNLLPGLPDGTEEADTAIPPYHDLVEQLAPTVALVAARFLAGIEPRGVGELLEEFPTLTEDALRGRYGRYALLQAAELCAVLDPDRAEEIRAALAVASRGAFDMEPDLLTTAARVTFGGPGAATSGPGVLDALEQESLTGELLLGWLGQWRTAGVLPKEADGDLWRRQAYVRLGGVGQHRISAMPSVLWQTALWTLAADHAPEETARRLAHWWQAPDGLPRTNEPLQFSVTLPYAEYGSVLVHVNRLLALRSPEVARPRLMITQGPTAGTDPRTAARIWSPWLVHHTPPPAKQGGPRDGAAKTPPPDLRGEQPEQLVRLLGASLLGARLLALGPAVGGVDHLLLLMVHVRDTLHRTFKPLMEVLRKDVRRAGVHAGHLCSLLTHADGVVDRVGKGVRPTVHPSEIVRVVSALETPARTSEGVRPPLPDWGARNAALHWVQESSSGGTGPHRTEAGGRWFTGEDSPAEALLSLIAQKERNPYHGTAVRAAQLRRDLRGHGREGMLRWDWGTDGPRFPEAPALHGVPSLTPAAVVLSGPLDPDRDAFSVEEWRDMSDGLSALLAADDEHALTPVTVRTLRLAALLGRPELGEAGSYAEWVTSWTGLVSSFNAPSHLPRYVRARMFDMFRSEVDGAGSQERLSKVLEHVIDVIVGLSGGAQFYYDRLFDELATRTLRTEMANRLRVRTLEALYQKWGNSPPMAGRGNPWATYVSRVSARGTESALVRFLRATASEELRGQATPLAVAMEGLWHRTQQPARYPARREALGLGSADARFVVAATADRRTEESVVFSRPERADVALDRGTRRPPVRDFFRSDSGSEDPAPGTFALGIVCSVPRVHENPQRLWVNCGRRLPVRYQVEPHERTWHIGQTVAVKLSEDPAEEMRAVAVVALGHREPVDGEVRTAQLRRTDRYPWLSLKVRHVDTECYRAGADQQDVDARRRWDPDLSRAFRTDEKGPSLEDTLAMWHAGLGRWVPLDAGLPELAAAAGGTEEVGEDGGDAGTPVRLVLAGPATDRSGFGTAWRFVTTPGHAYVLGPAAWEPEDWSRLEEACLADPHGLVVHAEFRAGENRLRLAPGDPFDRRNARWLAVFDRGAGTAEEGEDEERVSEQHAYEQAFRHTDAEGRPRWQIEVPAIEGFPRVVTAALSGADPHGTHLLCSVESWGDRGARQAEVQVLPFRERGIVEKPTPELYRNLVRHRANEVVELTWTARNAFRGQNLAFMADGLPGWVATESLTLTGEFPHAAKPARRWAVVDGDDVRPTSREHHRSEAVRLPARQLSGCCVGLDDPESLDRSSLSGVIVARIQDADRLRVWLSLGEDEVVEAVLPAECFDAAAPSVGDQFTGSRTDDGWLFSTYRRRLHLQALWEWASQPGSDWKSVGQVRVVDGEPLELYQDPLLPRLAWGPAPEDSEPMGRAHARREGKGRGNTIRVVVQHGGTPLVGSASRLELGKDFQPVHVEQTLLEVWDVGEEARRSPLLPAGTRFVQVTREFDMSLPAHVQRGSTSTAERVEDPVGDWLRLLLEPGLTLTGSLSPEDRLLLSTHQAPDDDGRYQSWLGLLDEPWAWVAGRNYSPDRVRAVPVPHASGYRASFLRAPALTVAEFMAEAVPYAFADGRRCVFKDARNPRGGPYYVGVEETDTGVAHRFEFGYGWFVDVPENALTVGGEPVDPQGLTLFHGDRIDAMSFGTDVSDTATGGITVSIDLADIDKGVEHQIHVEATTARVVHLLDVAVDRERQRVTVVRALTRSRDLGRGREDIHAVERPVSARLSAEDARALLTAHHPEGGQGARRQLILGRLQPEPEGRRRGALRFAAVRPRLTTGDESALRVQDRLYLEAGTIAWTGNDHLLRFELPAELRQDGEPLAVLVPRREFSHRESCLRRAAKTEGLGAYEGRARMLVELGNPNQGGSATANLWHGSTKSPPPRSLATLHSYLERRSEGCFGVVDASGRHIELRPGVLFSMTGMRAADGIAPGSVVRLSRDGADGVVVHQAIPADGTYLDDKPRPMVVFPKDSLKTAEDIRHADTYGRFTLAGLPGLNASALRGTGQELLRTEHPKIAGAVRKLSANGAVHAQLVPLTGQPAGTITFRAGEAVFGAAVKRKGQTLDGKPAPDEPIAWAQLSFMDATAEQIATACREWGWHYHDSRTRTWTRDGAKPRVRRLAPLARSIDEPVFFSQNGTGWTLRHEPSQLRRFGFPATELLEETFQEQTGGRRSHWVVARASASSVWLELAPGRIAEVCGELVRFDDGHSLADVDWSPFAPGDLLYGRVEGGVNECGHLVLEDWRPGLRGAFMASGPRRVLLPVSFVDDVAGAFYLGEGAAAFPFPAERSLLAAHAMGSSVWLDRTNALTSLADSAVTVGDVVLVAANPAGEGLRIVGLPHARVELAEDSASSWYRCSWLRADLAATATAGNSGLLSALGSLPMTVESVTEGPNPLVTVSRRHQPRSAWPDGSVLARPVADLGHGHLAVRVGSALIRLHVRMILPGLPDEAAPTTASALVRGGRLIRLHCDPVTRTLTSGLPGARNEPGETVVRAVLPVNGPDGTSLGTLCQDDQTQGLCWLPAEDAAWASKVPGDLMFGQLRRSRRLTVLRTARRTVSLVGHPLVAREYENLAAGQVLRVVVVGQAAEPVGVRSSGTLLVSVEPLGMLARYSPGTGATPTSGESLMAEVARLDHTQGHSTLRLVEPGSRKTVTDLPGWMCGALGRLYVPSFAQQALPVARLIPRRFSEYRDSYRAGNEGKAAPMQGSAGHAVHWAAGALDAATGDAFAEAGQRAGDAVAQWLCSDHGRGTVLQQDTEVDLAPLLVVCQLCAAFPQEATGLPRTWLPFLLGRLGDRALSSLHTEALVTEWLTRPERHGLDGDWRRLRTLSVAKRLTPGQVTTIEEFGRAITGRPTLNRESDAAPLARGLLAAVGRLPSAQGLREDARLLGGLAALGMSLRPADGRAIPSWVPLTAQRGELNKAFRKVLQGAIPLTLLPAYERLSTVGTEFATDLLREAERRRMSELS